MSNGAQTQDIDFTIDRDNLYREESVTDLKVATIRQLIPVTADGEEDSGRTRIFIGHTQVMSPEGPLPIQSKLEADTIEQAMEAFPRAMEQALVEMIEKIKQMQQQQRTQQNNDSRIIMPGQ